MTTERDITKLTGQLTDNDVHRLRMLAALVPPNGLLVEIGAFRGKSTAALASGMAAGCHLVSIDPWCLQVAGPQGYETLETMNAYRQAIEPWQQHITQIVAWPTHVIPFWGGEIDLLFMDCVKGYEGLYNLWRAWLPFVKPGGWCVSHDYHEKYSGVIQVIERVIKPATNNHSHVDYTWSGQKI